MPNVLRRIRAVGSVLLAASLSGGAALAFKPTELYGHLGITQRALADTYDVLALRGSTEMQLAVIAGNAGTDGILATNILLCANGTQEESAIPFLQVRFHCDDEEIAACSQLIAAQIPRIAALILDVDTDRARTCLGRTLHTTQDFYAHSTEVTRAFDGLEATFRAASANERSNRSITNRSRLLSGTLAREGSTGGYCLGTALVPEMFPPLAYVGSTLRDPVPPLVTGYFPGAADLAMIEGAPLWLFGLRTPLGHWEPPAGRCGHGINRPVELLGRITPGIAKDRLDTEPGWQQEAAQELALYATRDLIARVVAQVRTISPTQAQADDALRFFFGIPVPPIPIPAPAPGGFPIQPGPPPLPPPADGHMGALIDVTSSMGPVIAGVKAGIDSLAATVGDASTASTASASAASFTLVSYADPAIAAPLVTRDSAAFRSAVNALSEGSLGDGGDCREPTFAAIRTAISAMPSSGDLYVFTNSSSKDGELLQSVSEDAARKNVAIHIMNSGSCSPLDPAYKALAAATGGEFVQQEPGNPDAPRQFLELEAQNFRLGKPQLVFSVDRVIADPETIPFEVDSTVQRLMISTDMSQVNVVGTDDDFRKGQITLLDADGVAVAPAIDGYAGNSYAVDRPKPGTWTLRVTGAAGRQLTARANVHSALELLGTDFIALQGRPGHTGRMPRVDRPPAGTASELRVQLSQGELEEVTFETLGIDGNRRQQFSAQYAADVLGYVAELTPRADALRVSVRGRLPDGTRFQRASARTFTSSPYELFEVLENTMFVPGVPGVVRVVVNNRGDVAASPSISVESESAVKLSFEPRQLELEPGQSKLVEVEITLPEGPPPPWVKLQVWAGLSEDADHANFLETVRWTDQDQDTDGVATTLERGPSARDAAYDGNGDATPDAEQASVLSLPWFIDQYASLVLPAAKPVSNIRSLPMRPDVELPESATAPFGSMRFSLDDVDGPALALRLSLTESASAYPIDRLLAFDGKRSDWVSIADYDVATRSFAFSIQDRDGIDLDSFGGQVELMLAPAYAVGVEPGAPVESGGGAESGGCSLGRDRSRSGGGAWGCALLLGLAVARARRRWH